MNKRIASIIFLTTLVSRVLLWWSSLPFSAPPLTSDSHEYCQIAQTLLQGQFLTLVRTPVYPLFLALMGSPPCSSLNAIFLAQCLMDSATAVVIASIAWRLFRDQRAGIIAGFFWMLSPVAGTVTTFVMTETLFTFLVVIALWFAISSGSFWMAVIEGVCWSGVTLTRPSGVLLPLIVGAFLFIRHRLDRTDWRKPLLAVAIYGLCMAVWIGYNYRRIGEPVISLIEMTAIYTFEVAAVEMLDHYSWPEYARMWIFEQSRTEPIREQFQRRFAEEIRRTNPALPPDLYLGWGDLPTVRAFGAEAKARLNGRFVARTYTHIVGAVQTLRPVLRWPRGGGWMTWLECLRLLALACSAGILIWRRQWWLLLFAGTWTAYTLLLPGVCGLWRFRAMAEPLWTIMIAAATIQLISFRRSRSNTLSN